MSARTTPARPAISTPEPLPPTLPAPTDGVDMAKLIGRPHLFAKLKSLRNGLLIEPLGLLTLQPDGRLTGYSNPNEGSWIPYLHGEVPAKRAFTFLTRHNKWIPSSTWTQSIGDIPVGYFCDEPEMAAGLTRLCLVPHIPSPPSTRVIYLVATCLRFYKRTMPAILEQLAAEGIPADRIKVVVNGAKRNSSKTIDGVDHAFTTHDAWEWSALYEAPLRWQFTYAFLIHDTSLVLPGFRRAVEAINGHVAWDFLPATPLARCLLGLYSHSFLTRLNPWLKSIDGIDKQNGILAEVGAELLLRARAALVISDPDRNLAASGAEWREIGDFFNTGMPRIRRTFPAVRVHKFLHSGATSEHQL